MSAAMLDALRADIVTILLIRNALLTFHVVGRREAQPVRAAT
jgi:hypothetical protein